MSNRVFMCTCCPSVLLESDLVTDSHGDQCCPLSGEYIPARAWDDNWHPWHTKSRLEHFDDEDFGFCEECGNDYHPHVWLIDDFGAAVCKNDATILVPFVADNEYY